MFKHLPVITNESLDVMISQELGYFKELLRQCTEGAPELDTVINLSCAEFKDTNPNLVKAVKACAFGISATLEEDGVPPETAWQAGVLAAPGVLSVLRLIDRALESESMEKKFS